MSITQSRMMFVGVILLLVSRTASAQSPSTAHLSPADLVKAVIRSELNTSDVTEIRWKYLLVKEVGRRTRNQRSGRNQSWVA